MSKKRILLVDDETSLSHLVKVSLEKTGVYEVKVENQGRHALEVIRTFRPHLVLLDVCLLDTDGGIVADEILSDRELKHTPIIFMTSLVSPQEVREGPLFNGGIPILAKPFDSVKLIACIERTLADQAVQGSRAVSEKGASDTRLIKKTLLERKLALQS